MRRAAYASAPGEISKAGPGLTTSMSPVMSVDQQLLFESRVRMRQAAIAAAAAILLVGAAAIQISGIHTKVNELTLDLIIAHQRFPLDVIGAIVNGAGLLAMGFTLAFLIGLARARNPDLRGFIRPLALAGGALAGLTGIIYSIVIAQKASDFVNHGAQTYEQANHLTSGGLLLALPLFGQAAALLLAVAFVLVALHSMKVGLLTRFMGYLGIFTGILVLFPIGSPVPVVQAFWLLGLAYLFTGRWPSGVPPTWRSGTAEPWPSSASLREQRTKAAEQRGSGRGGGAQGSGARGAADRPSSADTTATTTVQPRTRAATPKRKRKRRR